MICKRQVGLGPGLVWEKGFYVQVNSRERSGERGSVCRPEGLGAGVDA